MPNLSQARFLELENAEKRLKDMVEREAIMPFAQDFANSLATVLGSMPYDKWPREAKLVFEACARMAPTAAQLYKNRLPEE